MAINIKDLETEKLARKAATLLNCSITGTIKQALHNLLSMQGSGQSAETKTRELLKIGAHCAARELRDARSADEILGYDQHGLPSSES